jgi:CDP-glucose 4,6-dehydratase
MTLSAAGTLAFADVFRSRRVLLTGHTGFKGGWMSFWLARLGAKVTGIALPPEAGQSFFAACGVDQRVDSRFADITDASALAEALAGTEPEIVIHMAAQSLVRRSYEDPVGTFATNVIGTANVLDWARRTPSVRAILVVTSDKCYENNEWVWGYRENDPLGGVDPYSASKGCTEILAHSFRRSFFSGEGAPCLATARAGNVFGGGDWSRDRLVPDIVRAISRGEAMTIRNPGSVRPWQHVLEPIAGYLLLCQRLLSSGSSVAGAWNFGPDAGATVSVGDFVNGFAAAWGDGAPRIETPPQKAEGTPHEAGLLRLDSTKARVQLGWTPRLSLDDALQATASWYRAYLAGKQVSRLTEDQIEGYERAMFDVGATAPHRIAAQ